MAEGDNHPKFLQSKAPLQDVAVATSVDDVVRSIAAVPTFRLEMVAGLFEARQKFVAVEAPEEAIPFHTFLRRLP